MVSLRIVGAVLCWFNKELRPLPSPFTCGWWQEKAGIGAASQAVHQSHGVTWGLVPSLPLYFCPLAVKWKLQYLFGSVVVRMTDRAVE